MAGCVDELLELPVGHGRAVNPEAVDSDAMARRLLGIMMVRTHAKGSAGNEDHLAALQVIRQPLAVIQIRSQHGGSSDTRIPPDATAPTLGDFDDSSLPCSLDALSDPYFFGPRGEEDTACVHISFLCTHVCEHAANPCRVRSAIRRARPLNITKVANGTRRLDGCDVQFVPVCVASW